MLGRLRRYSVGEDEEVLARARQHFVVLLVPILLMVVLAGSATAVALVRYVRSARA